MYVRFCFVRRTAFRAFNSKRWDMVAMFLDHVTYNSAELARTIPQCRNYLKPHSLDETCTDKFGRVRPMPQQI